MVLRREWTKQVGTVTKRKSLVLVSVLKYFEKYNKNKEKTWTDIKYTMEKNVVGKTKRPPFPVS